MHVDASAITGSFWQDGSNVYCREGSMGSRALT